MKTKNIKLFLYASSLFFATSCTDLNVDIKSQYTSFPNSEDAAEAVAANIYNYYREALGGDHWMVQTLSSDEAVSVALGSDYYDGGIYMQLDLHSWRSDLSKLSTIWNSAMKGVTGCNQVLQILGDTESTGAAPVRAMRAFYYFILMDNFGNVPIQKSISDTPSDRSPRKDVCEFIESELLAVRDKLTTTVDETTYGKATRYMADALLV
ncbi:MAG: RagB/SusD family nutrient uptake outer membrane protein, partial [Parabacteroides sp.]